MSLIKFTVGLNNVKMEKRRHAVRHAIGWITKLDYNEKYRKYTCSNIFRLMYFDDDGNSLVEVFVLAYLYLYAFILEVFEFVLDFVFVSA